MARHDAHLNNLSHVCAEPNQALEHGTKRGPGQSRPSIWPNKKPKHASLNSASTEPHPHRDQTELDHQRQPHPTADLVTQAICKEGSGSHAAVGSGEGLERAHARHYCRPGVEGRAGPNPVNADAMATPRQAVQRGPCGPGGRCAAPLPHQPAGITCPAPLPSPAEPNSDCSQPASRHQKGAQPSATVGPTRPPPAACLAASPLSLPVKERELLERAKALQQQLLFSPDTVHLVKTTLTDELSADILQTMTPPLAPRGIWRHVRSGGIYQHLVIFVEIMELDSLRKKIDSVDSKILSLLNERASISLNVGLAKKALENTKPDQDSAAKSKDEVYVPTREKAIFEKLIKMNHGPLANESIIAIYREVMSASISLQKEVTIAFLGPAGTHTHQAATARFGDSVLYVPQDTIADIFTAVEQGRATYGVVPFENSTFGSVSQTLDRFISSNVQIRGETYLGVHHCLMSNSSMQQIRRIYSHPEAFGQCQRWLDANLGNVERINVSSTAFAAELASKELHSAAICSYACAELYGLDIIQQKIEDMRNNTTRFFIIAPTSDPSPSADDRTLILFTVDHRIAGALCDALRTFKDFGINLTKIDSRPSGQRMWHYVFFVEMEGHMKNETVVKAMEELQKVCVDLRVLGSYPNQRSFVVA